MSLHKAKILPHSVQLSYIHHGKGYSRFAGLSNLDPRLLDFLIYILFNKTYNHVSIVAWSMMPTIRTCQGSNPNDGGLCLEVNFNDGGPNEKAFLNRIDNCVYSGSFEKLEVARAATSE